MHEEEQRDSFEHPIATTEPMTANDVTTPWATIEEHMKSRDEMSIKKIADDLDTMLVFAGLYSGVLTGFIIEFYKLLQQDTDQLTVDLLSRISSQLANASIDLGPDPSKTSSSTAATSTIVNVLWFSSLYMSLAAALFAMLAKKWLREYLSWTSHSAGPSELVILRQLRSRAWDQWQTPAIIGLIPAMLQLAVIIFLAGLVVLTWTLNSIIASIMTVFEGIFMIIMTALVLLPVTRFDCPYKSPIAWGWIWANKLIIRYSPQGRAGSLWHRWRQIHLSATSWIRRELFAIIDIPKQARNITTDLKAEFAAGVLVPMIHALSWTRTDTEHRVVLGSVDACLNTLHETADRLVSSPLDPRPSLSELILHRLNATLFASCTIFGLNPSEIRGAVRATYRVPLLQKSTLNALTELRGRLASVYDPRQRVVYRAGGSSHDDLLTLIGRTVHHPRRRASEEEIRIVNRMLVAALNFAASHMFTDDSTSSMPTPNVPSSSNDAGIASAATQLDGTTSSLGLAADRSAATDVTVPHLPSTLKPTSTPLPTSWSPRSVALARFPACYHSFIDIFCLIEAVVTVRPPERNMSTADEFIDSATRMYTVLYQKRELDQQYMGLRTVIFRTLCTLGHPERIVPGLLTDRMSSGRMLDYTCHLDESAGPANRYAIAATKMYRDAHEYSQRPENRHLFAIAADMAFANCDTIPDMGLLVELLRVACEAAKLCQEQKWDNCGCYHELPWLGTLIQKLQRDIVNFPYYHVLQLLDVLTESAKQGLLRDTDAAELTVLARLCVARGGTSDVPLLGSATPTALSQDFSIDEAVARIHNTHRSPSELYTAVFGSSPRTPQADDSPTVGIMPHVPFRESDSSSSIASAEYSLRSDQAMARHDELSPLVSHLAETSPTDVGRLRLQTSTSTTDTMTMEWGRTVPAREYGQPSFVAQEHELGLMGPSAQPDATANIARGPSSNLANAFTGSS